MQINFDEIKKDIENRLLHNECSKEYSDGVMDTLSIVKLHVYGYMTPTQEPIGIITEEQIDNAPTMKDAKNLCDDCRIADNCPASLKGLTGCKTTKCFRHEWAEKEKENEKV